MREAGLQDRPRITIIYDGRCPYCVAQANMLRGLDREGGRIGWVDLTASGFDAATFGLKPEDVMTQVHGVMPDGATLRGMEVIRRAYGVVGWGWMVAPTGWPGLKWLCDRGYAWFAKNRRRWSWTTRGCDEGRCDV